MNTLTTKQITDTVYPHEYTPASVFPREEVLDIEDHDVSPLFHIYWPESPDQLSIDVNEDGTLYVHSIDSASGAYTEITVPADDDALKTLSTWLKHNRIRTRTQD